MNNFFIFSQNNLLKDKPFELEFRQLKAYFNFRRKFKADKNDINKQGTIFFNEYYLIDKIWLKKWKEFVRYNKFSSININRDVNDNDYNLFRDMILYNKNEITLPPLDNSNIYNNQGEINPLAEFIIIDKKCQEIFGESRKNMAYNIIEKSVPLAFFKDKIILHINTCTKLFCFRDDITNKDMEIIIIFKEQGNINQIFSDINQTYFRYWLKDKGFHIYGHEELDIEEQVCKFRIINKNLKLQLGLVKKNVEINSQNQVIKDMKFFENKNNNYIINHFKNNLNEIKEQNEIETLKRTIEDLKNKNQLLENEKNKILQEKTQEKEKLQNMIDSLSTKMNIDKIKYKDKINEYINILNTMKNENMKNLDKIKFYESKIKLLTEDKEKCLKDNNQMKQKYELIIKDLNEKLQFFENYKIEKIKLEYEKKIEMIKNQYKEEVLQNFNDIRKNLIQTAETNIKNLTQKYKNMYKKKEEKLDKKYNEIIALNININENEIYYNKIKEENIKFKKIISKFPFNLLENEYIILLIIMTKDEKIIFPLMCKNSDKLNKIENIFFSKFPEYSKNKGKFYAHYNLIKPVLSLEENNIKNNDIIIFEY